MLGEVKEGVFIITEINYGVVHITDSQTHQCKMMR